MERPEIYLMGVVAALVFFILVLKLDKLAAVIYALVWPLVLVCMIATLPFAWANWKGKYGPSRKEVFLCSWLGHSWKMDDGQRGELCHRCPAKSILIRRG